MAQGSLQFDFTNINLHVGKLAGGSNTGAGNTFIGQAAGQNNNGNYGIFIGEGAGYINSGSNNIFIGYSAGPSNTSGQYNSFLGVRVGYNNQTGSNNTIAGYEAGGDGALAAYSFSNNCFFGYHAGYTNKTAGNNIAMGFEACSLNTYAQENVAIGYQALAKQDYGTTAWNSYNAAIGNNALFSNNPTSSSTGIKNTAVGHNAGYANTTGYNNTFLGYNADNTGATTINNAAAIGADAVVKFSNNMVLGDNNTKVGINLSSSSSAILSPLSVGGVGGTTIKGYFYNSLTTGGAALKAEMPAGTSGNNYGVIGTVPSGTSNGYGVQGDASNGSTQTGGVSIGVYGIAGNVPTGYNYGVYGKLVAGNGASIYGSFASPVSVPAQYAGYFAGLIRTTNDSPEKPTSGSWAGYSDERLKKDIAPFNDGLNVLKQINPITYKFNGIGDLPTEKTNIGIIAQDVKKVAPYCIGSGKLMVKESEAQNFGTDVVATLPADSSGEIHSIISPLTYSYDGLIYVMINSIKELSHTVDSLLAVKSGQRTNESGSDGQGKTETTLQVELANMNKIILYDAQPNPFSTSTVIRYFIPEDMSGSAYITFLDMYGNEVNKIAITEKGFGKIEASTQNLASGIYSYSIVVDGKTIDSKQMIKTK
ncbi:MAG: tail fiber domain-containing protein [Bacteroidetes bacterium]|nr:tail fiber domain-containing protein [Bacteroidota bacterium]